MNFNFDEKINRNGTNSLKVEGFRDYMFDGDQSLKFDYKDDDLIHMWVADMEFATPEFILDAIRDRLDRKILGYTKVFDSDYYEAVTSWTKNRNSWDFDEKELVTSPGIIPALFELVEYICDKKDDDVLIFTPSYAYFEKAVKNSNRNLITSPLIYNKEDYTFEIDFDDVEEKLQKHNIKLCIFCNPHNPTGKIWSEKELLRLAQLIKKNDVWLISDEIHCDIRRKGKKYTPFANILADYEKLIITFSHSKAFNIAGLMFSNVVIKSEQLLRHWKKEHYDFENPLSIAGHQAAYEHGARWLDKMNEYLDGNFEYTSNFFKSSFPNSNFEIPDSTYLAWIDVSEYLPDEVENIPLYFANKSGVLLEGGDMFVNNSKGFIRLNLAMPMNELKVGLDRIGKGLLDN